MDLAILERVKTDYRHERQGEIRNIFVVFHFIATTHRAPLFSSMALRVKLLTAEAKLPVRGSALAAGYDLCAAYSGVGPARGKALIKTDIAIAVPPGTYGRVGACPGLRAAGL